MERPRVTAVFAPVIVGGNTFLLAAVTHLGGPLAPWSSTIRQGTNDVSTRET
ncbi:hypothetical protein [Haladaptatus sp. AB643]|uniref:hypothetical protein n=1 Tax=Haladaptatus sp. AB643 TaxID=2934174 RepID=UPI00209C57DC|nr:hypothetical protein [Haladaptatus sp. AB643]MCO8244181.1 hypothetical protein [Haladaptatus sp. AB643]